MKLELNINFISLLYIFYDIFNADTTCFSRCFLHIKTKKNILTLPFLRLFQLLCQQNIFVFQRGEFDRGLRVIYGQIF